MESHPRHWLGAVLFIVLTLQGPTTIAAEIADEDNNVLMGAGAHFAWILFDAIQADLEAKVGRKTILFGKNSMLGVGCKAGIKAAKQGTKSRETFGFVCCPLSDEEIETEGLIVYPLAKEPILILGHEDNPVDDLSTDQARAIFRGEIINWNTVGGPARPIVVVTRLHCKKRPGHWKTILPSQQEFRQERLNVKSAATMVQRVSDFSSAIGHTGATWEFKPEQQWRQAHSRKPGQRQVPFLPAVIRHHQSSSIGRCCQTHQGSPNRTSIS